MNGRILYVLKLPILSEQICHILSENDMDGEVLGMLHKNPGAMKQLVPEIGLQLKLKLRLSAVLKIDTSNPKSKDASSSTAKVKDVKEKSHGKIPSWDGCPMQNMQMQSILMKYWKSTT